MDTRDQVEKQIELNAPQSRVWRALTDSTEFGKWFGVKFETPFEAGKSITGMLTIENYDHLSMEFVPQKLEPETYFSYTWHPYAIDPTVDYSQEPQTLVEFTLSSTATGTLLHVKESGFQKLPPDRIDICLKMNEGGWASQMRNIKTYVDETS